MDKHEVLEKVKAIPGLVDVHWEGDRLVAYKSAAVHQVELDCHLLVEPPQGHALEPVPAPVAITRPQSGKEAQEARPRGFDVKLLKTYWDEWTPDELGRLRKIIDGSPMILTRTKDGTKIMASIMREVELIVAGTWLSAHHWRNLRDELPIAKLEFKSINDVLDDLAENLDNIAVEITRNGYSWPPVKDGCRKRCSLLDFIVTTGRDGLSWSPWMSARAYSFGDWEQVRASFPGDQRKLLDKIFMASWLYPKASSRAMLSWWRGAKKFIVWYSSNRDLLLDQPGTSSRVVWGTLTSAFMAVEDWMLETGSMPTAFIGPWSSQWGDFRRWLETSRGTTLPRG